MTDFKTSDRDVNRAIRSWLREDRHEDVSRIAGAVLDQVEATPQRRATWWPARRTPIMNKMVGFGLAAAAVFVAILVGAQLLGGPTGGIGSQATSTPEPTATPEPTPSAVGFSERPHVVYESTDGGVPISVTIAAPGWAGQPGTGILEKGSEGADPPDGAGLIAFHIDREYYVYGEACQWSTTRPDTPATTVDELIDALAKQGSRDESAPEDITVDGYDGKKIILRMHDVDIDACDEGTFALFGVTGEDPARWSQGPGQIEEVWAMDVDGQVVVLDGLYYAETPQDVVDELRAILASATFDEP